MTTLTSLAQRTIELSETNTPLVDMQRVVVVELALNAPKLARAVLILEAALELVWASSMDTNVNNICREALAQAEALTKEMK